MTGQRPPVASCRSCWAPVIWATTPAGKRIPVDQEPSEDGTIELSEGLRPVATVVSRTGREPGTKLYRSHFATCPAADSHRQRATRSIPSPMPQEGLFSDL